MADLLVLCDLGLSGRGALTLLRSLVFRRPWGGRSFVMTAPAPRGVSHSVARTLPWSEGREFGALVPRYLSSNPLRWLRTHCCKRALLSCAESLLMVTKSPRSRAKLAQGVRCAFSKRGAVPAFCAAESPKKRPKLTYSQAFAKLPQFYPR